MSALIVWKCVHGAAPAYLQELCVPVEDVRGCPRLHLLDVFSYEGEDINGTAKFCVPHGPSVCNSLPSTLHDISLSLRAERVQRAAKDVSLWS